MLLVLLISSGGIPSELIVQMFAGG